MSNLKYKGKYKNIIFGCQMNVHDSEKIAGILEGLGYEATDDINEADVIAFNTCCIRDTAEKRALGNIGATKPLKAKNKNLIVIVCGCMPQQNGVADMIKVKFPFVDIILGTHNLSELGNKMNELLLKRKRIVEIKDVDGFIDDEITPMARTSYPNAWVNIIYGCNNFCTYCIVPFVRGRERSRNINSILNEIKQLILNGYKEITLLGQNVNSYGNDFKDKSINFATLLDEIGKLDGKFRIRFMTSHPKDLSAEVVDVIAKYDNICNNIHLPIQAGSNNVLKNMNRRYTREHYLSLIKMIREKLPQDTGITTDIMVGFPGETEEDFLETLDLIKQVQFASAFTFIYSSRKGTKASDMQQIDFKTKQRRIAELIKVQNKITEQIGQNMIGQTVEVLIDGVNKKYNTVCGRTDTGKLVNVKGSIDLLGAFLNVKIVSAKSASLFGEIV